jgi:hypothetical protein
VFAFFINSNLSDRNAWIKTVFFSLLMLIVCSSLLILWSSNQRYSTVSRNLSLLLQLQLIFVCRRPAFAFFYVYIPSQTNFKSTTVILILDIIHYSVFYLKHKHFGDWILSPSSGRNLFRSDR